MNRPAKPRTTTAVRFKPAVYDALREAAADREVSMNWLVNRAVADYLDRLIPVDQIVWTRDQSPATRQPDQLHHDAGS